MDHIRGLRFGPLDAGGVHVCVDMQRLFAADTPWASGAVAKALPAAREITAAKPGLTIFTCFLCPSDPRGATGQWRRLYANCPEMTRLDPRLYSIVPELLEVSRDPAITQRHVFSVFAAAQFQKELVERSANTLVFTGIETDVCVLASVLSAVDGGYRVVVVEEGVASSNETGHRAALEGILPRFDQQIELVGVDELLGAWP
ncbi:MAG: cysteine hydrolase family protein [Pseudomonadota bacterium]